MGKCVEIKLHLPMGWYHPWLFNNPKSDSRMWLTCCTCTSLVPQQDGSSETSGPWPLSMPRYQWMQRRVLWLHPHGLSNWKSCFYQEIRKQTKYEKDWFFLHIDSVFCFSDPFFLHFYLINTCFLYFSSFIIESCVPLCFQSRQEGWTSKRLRSLKVLPSWHRCWEYGWQEGS